MFWLVPPGEYDGVVHAVGMLFAGSLNRFASGSGSVPDPGTTYDKITRQTAFAATAALDDLAQAKGGGKVISSCIVVTALRALGIFFVC